ncbi:GspE/PulE family protein [Puniceicoccaceae bacterium K14]|nr:GspE/PulE family protein [Puniceicoccaceae bacterium K14]
MADASLILQLAKRKELVQSEQLLAMRDSMTDKSDDALVNTLIDRGFFSRESIVDMIATEFSMSSVDLTRGALPASPGDLLELRLAKRFNAFPLSFESGALKIAISDPLDFESIDNLSHILNVSINPVLADKRQIERAIDVAYDPDRNRSRKLYSENEEELADQVDISSKNVVLDTNLDGEEDAPIIRLVQVIIADAVRQRASDIHFEPLENRFRLRFRIDGVLQDAPNPPPKRLQLPVISRIKVMGKMSIAEKRLPQDGRIQVRVEGKEYDLRVSSLPTAYGESIVMRILDKTGLMKGLPELGFLSDDQDVFEQMISLPDGIVLITGPTGSGKTTTLYSCLNYINRSDCKIITVEDPIEYQMSGINQVPVKKDVGMDFAAALKSMLRQAPNIIMIGEIRDLETAEIAINASLTGHMVFSTLHTNDAPSAVTRLVDLGVKPYLVATSLRASVAQRLVRCVCQHCSESYAPNAYELQVIGMTPSSLGSTNFKKGKGCPECGFAGNKGRFGVFEIFPINEEVERMIYSGGTSTQLRTLAKQLGMRTMREDGIRKVVAGLTTLEEVLAVTVSEFKAV